MVLATEHLKYKCSHKSDVNVVTSLYRNLSNMDTSLCPFSASIRGIRLYKQL